MTMTPVFLTGPRKIANLRLLSLRDLPELLVGANKPEIQQFMGFRGGPISEDFERAWLERVKEPNDTDIVMGVVERGSGTLAGAMGLHNIDHVHGTASTGAFFWNVSLHGQGLGTDAKFALLHWALSAMPLRKITSSVLSNNPRSKCYQEKTGYSEVGRRRGQYFKNGSYVDEILMEVFREDFFKAYRNYVTAD